MYLVIIIVGNRNQQYSRFAVKIMHDGIIIFSVNQRSLKDIKYVIKIVTLFSGYKH